MSLVLRFTAICFLIEFSCADTPFPLVWEPSQFWDGIDGAWSSFFIQFGTPIQYARVIPSINTYEILLVDSVGCPINQSIRTPLGTSGAEVKTCEESRGKTVDFSKSSTAHILNIFTTDLNKIYGSNIEGRYGTDIVVPSVETRSNELSNQVLGTFSSTDVWNGIIGLIPTASNFTDFTDPQPSLLQRLYNETKIPSLSWGYTAGARHKNKGIYGSLVLGGYDQSRFQPNNVTFRQGALGSGKYFELAVLDINLVSEDQQGSKNSIRLVQNEDFDGNRIILASSTAYMWLPLATCRSFEAALNLTWDVQTELYLLDKQQRQELMQRNLTFEFDFSDDFNMNSPNITIKISYASFDQQITIFNQNPNQSFFYFPLKRATDPAQYTLGRVFLQETYLFSDFHRNTFSLSQARFDENLNSKIVTVLPPSNSSGDGSKKPIDPSNSSGDGPKKPIAPIVGGVVCGIILISSLCLIFRKKVLEFCRKYGPVYDHRQEHKSELEENQNASEEQTDQERQFPGNYESQGGAMLVGCNIKAENIFINNGSSGSSS